MLMRLKAGLAAAKTCSAFAVVDFVIILSALLAITSCQVCTQQEMVYNGDFSNPSLESQWTILGYLPGGNGVWTSIPANNGFKVQKVAIESAPLEDCEDSPTGQSLLINGNEDWAQISYYINIPCMLESTIATISFDYWFTSNFDVRSFDFTIEQQTTVLISESMSVPPQGWDQIYKTFDIKSCQPLKLTFTSDAGRGASAVIDNVSLKVPVCTGLEMVHGGDFEAVSLCTSSEILQQLPCSAGVWTSTLSKPGFVLWQEGAMGIPAKGANGKPTGNFLEVNGLNNKATMSYQYFVPSMLGVAESTIIFQYYFRSVSEVNYFGIELQQDSATVLTKSLASSFKAGGWASASFSADLKASKAATLVFVVDSCAIGGVYIDAVSVTTTERVDQLPTCACPADDEILERTQKVQKAVINTTVSEM